MRDCIKRMVEKSNGAINQQAAKEILDTIEREARRAANDGFEYEDAVKNIIAERVKNTKENIIKQKRNVAKNVLIKAQTTAKLSDMVGSGMSVKEAFLAELEGINSEKTGARDSLDVKRNAVENAYLSKFVGDLNREGLLPLLNSKTLDDDIGKELWALSMKEKGATQNKQAARIAEIIYSAREGQRLRLNKAGADIGETAGYIMPQRHDTLAMHKAGEDEWANFMIPLLDEKRSFGGDSADLFDTLRGAYRAMVSGIRLNDPLEKSPKLFQFSGPANIGKKLSQSRQIHFKDYASWKKWNDTYGMKDLNEGVMDSIRYDANNIAMMERYGTNPEAMLKAVADDVKKKFRDKVAEEGEQGIASKIDSIIAAAMGHNNIPVDPKLSKIGSNIRAYNNVTMLGGAVISSITDIPMKSLEYQFQGKSWLSSTAQPFMDIAQGFKSKKERVEFSSMVGVGMESIIGDIGGRFSAQDTLSNKASKVQRLFFKLNGLAWWTDTHQGAMGRVMAHHLGLKSADSYADLDADTKRLFGNYRITEKDWDIARASMKTLEDGRNYILPSEIKNEAVSEKFFGYFADRASIGVIAPSAKEQRLVTMGTQRGTPIGEATRFIMQFKSFPVSAITKVWGRALYGKGKADVPALIYLMTMTMTFGYVAGAAKDLIKGKTPKDPRRLETAYASLAQGGGLGILGDILLNDSSGFGRSATQTLAGPTFGRIDDIAKIYSAGMRGGGSKAQLAKTAISAVPFNNLFYTRAALDQMMLLQFQEHLNPGYLKRMERNMNKTYGQKLLF